MFLLDTNAASDIIKARSQAARRALIDAQAHTRVCLSVLSQAEFLFGFRKRPDALRLRKDFEDFTSYVEVLSWNEEAARSFAELRLALRERNRTLETMDLLIAAQAHALGATLVSRDKDFRHLSELLNVVNWATDLN